MNESEDMYREVNVENTHTQLELKNLWKYTEYGIRVLGFTKIGKGVISQEFVVQTDEDGKVVLQKVKQPAQLFKGSKCYPLSSPVDCDLYRG